MSSLNDRTRTWKVVITAALMFAMAASSARGCSICDSRNHRSGEETANKGILQKRDIFMSRGWEPGGGHAFATKSNFDMRKTPRIIEMLVNDDDETEMVPESRTEDFRARPPPNIVKTWRRAYHPQLFISSGWGPLGK